MAKRTLLAPRRRERRSTGTAAENPALQAIWDAVCQIPRGQVSTYGEVARAAGLPGRARQAGYALKHLPPGMHVPWHRVVGAGGKIAFPQGTTAFREQARRLRSEGIEVANGRVPRGVLQGGLLGD